MATATLDPANDSFRQTDNNPFDISLSTSSSQSAPFTYDISQDNVGYYSFYGNSFPGADSPHTHVLSGSLLSTYYDAEQNTNNSVFNVDAISYYSLEDWALRGTLSDLDVTVTFATTNTGYVYLTAGSIAALTAYENNLDITFDGGSGRDIVAPNPINLSDPPAPSGALSGDDTFRGNGGDDSLDAGYGDDLIEGGVGVDTLTGSGGADILRGGPNGDQLLGDNPQLVGQPGYASGNDTIYGDGGDDFIYGQEGDDTLRGGSGNDQLEGWFGDDLLYGDAGQDVLYGYQGNNALRGGTGADQLWGDVGNDALYGGEGNDLPWGGDGNDTAYYADSPAGVVVNMTGDAVVALGRTVAGASVSDGWGTTDDILSARIERWVGSGSGDHFAGDDAASTFTGGDGNDTFLGGLGNDVLDGGNGLDTASYTSAGAGVAASLVTRRGNGGVDNKDTLISIENLTGSASNDTLTGDGGANRLDGGAGSDTLDGGAGADRLVVSAGTDRVAGFATGAGGDVLDLSGLLPGVAESGSVLDDYLQFRTVGADTRLRVDVEGARNFTAPEASTTLPGVTLLAVGQTQAELIDALLGSGNLDLA